MAHELPYIAAIEEATPHIDTFYAPATSEYLRRDGRISLYEMNVGPLRGMLPLIRVWGRVAVIGKAKTQAENVDRMLELAEQELAGNEAIVVVTHANNAPGAAQLAELDAASNGFADRGVLHVAPPAVGSPFARVALRSARTCSKTAGQSRPGG